MKNKIPIIKKTLALQNIKFISNYKYEIKILDYFLDKYNIFYEFSNFDYY